MLPVPFPANTVTNYAGLINHSANLVHCVVPVTEIPQAKHLAIHCDYDELVTVLATATIPIATRILSAILFAFPHVRPHLYAKAEVTPYANVAQYRAALDQTAAANYATPCDHRFMCLISLYLLGPSHMTDHKLPLQILKRMSAAFAGKDLLIPTSVELTAVIQTCLWKSGDIPALIYGILGRVLSVNDDLEYVRLAQVADLITPTNMATHMTLSSLSFPLYTQMRLVYMKVQATSLNFALYGYDIGCNRMIGLGGTFATDARAFTLVRNTIRNCPYIGLVETQDEIYTVKQFPRMVHLGAVIYQAALRGTEEVTEFSRYSLEGVQAHIPEFDHIGFLKALAGSLGSSKDRMLALAACHMTPDEVDHLMLDAPPGTREKVYGLVGRNGQQSAWVAKERHDRQTRTLIRLKQSFDTILKERIDTLTKHLEAIMDTMDNNKDRMRMRILWNTSKQAAFDSVAQMLSLER